MEVIRRRLPNRTEASLLFTACAFPLYTWALLMYFHQLPNYLLRMSLPAALAVLAYVLVVALLDTLLAFSFLVFTCLALPDKFFKAYCAAQGALAFLVTFIWVIPVHFQNDILDRLGWNMPVYNRWVLVWIVTYLVALLGGSWLIRRSGRFEAVLVAFCDRLSILTSIYLSSSILGLAIVMIRNLT